ncbi:Transposase IS116/IS110/IS902 family protein [compost metagenome]
MAGERSPQVLAELAKGRMRIKIPELIEALTGRFKEHHAFICGMHLERIDHLSQCIEQLTVRIEEAMGPFLVAREFLTTIPGVSTLVADVLIAESGADMGRFEDAGHLCSWAGLTPGHNQSAGRVRSAHTRPGNRYLYLKGALSVAALVVARHPKGTYLGARYKRLVIRRGKPKALAATERSILTAVWHMLAQGECYREAGADYFAVKDPDRARRNAVKRLHDLGYDVQLTEREAA